MIRIIGKRERVGNHRPDFRITFLGLSDSLEITNAHNEGHARSIALDYLRRVGKPRASADSVSVEKLPTDLGRHKARIAEAKGNVLPPSGSVLAR